MTTRPHSPPSPSHRRTPTGGAHSSRPRNRSRISGGWVLGLILGAFLAALVLVALALLGVIGWPSLFTGDDSPSTSPTHHPSSPSRSNPSNPSPTLPDLVLRAVPTSSDTSSTSSATPLSGLTTLNLYFLDAPSSSPSPPPHPISTASPGPNTHPAGLAAYSCVPTPDQAVRSLCWGTLLLPEGQLSFQGAQPDRSNLGSPPSAPNNHDVLLTVTGGTDAYAAARGTLFVDTLPPPFAESPQQDWTVHFTSSTPR